jgi:hypothetical protein
MPTRLCFPCDAGFPIKPRTTIELTKIGTYQERLSRRALIFTQEQVFWCCASTTRFEETLSEPKTLKLVIKPDGFGCNELLDFGLEKYEALSIHEYMNT